MKYKKPKMVLLIKLIFYFDKTFTENSKNKSKYIKGYLLLSSRSPLSFQFDFRSPNLMVPVTPTP